jgi:tRNA dimethylallyltransferase
MDSAMVYRGMDIGTAKPDRAALGRVPHHLIDIRDPEQTYSAGQFRTDALAAIGAIRARARLPLLVGGTLLYLRALREGLAPLPERDAQVRAQIDAEAAVRGWDALHAELAEVDAEAATRIDPRDRQRIQRALEVHRVTGRPLSELLRRAAAAAPAVAVTTFALVPENRERLGERVAARFDAMVAAGLVDEVRRLRTRPGLSAGHPSMRSVGYRQIWAHLDGACDWDEARRRAIAATRQLAKRQMTWLRSESGVTQLPASAEELEAKLSSHILEAVDRGG